LVEGGVNVAIGTDNIRDPFNPFSNADPLFHASVAALACHMVGIHDYRTVLRLLTVTASAILGFDRRDLGIGAQADVVVFDAQSLDGLLDGATRRVAIIRRGYLSDDVGAVRTGSIWTS
jgi:cytosine deaminase